MAKLLAAFAAVFCLCMGTISYEMASANYSIPLKIQNITVKSTDNSGKFILDEARLVIEDHGGTISLAGDKILNIQAEFMSMREGQEEMLVLKLEADPADRFPTLIAEAHRPNNSIGEPRQATMRRGVNDLMQQLGNKLSQKPPTASNAQTSLTAAPPVKTFNLYDIR